MLGMANTRTPKKVEGTGINVVIPKSLHKRLRLRAIGEGLTMTTAVEQAIREWLR
jgi:predicted HicB family RNase H-like nuclease